MGRPRYQLQEKRLRTRDGAKQTPGSGSGNRKGDAHGLSFCVSAKTTEAKQFRLTLTDLDKMTLDAAREERLPVMQIDFGIRDEQFAVLRWADFRAFLEAAGIDL